MADTRIVSILAFNSILSSSSLMKRSWRKIATSYIDNGATKVICLQATNVKAASLTKLKYLSKAIWDLTKLKAFLDELDVSKTASNWAVSVKYLGSFITAVTDFKDLAIAKSELNVEMITSTLEKIVLAVRCLDSSSGECLFLRRSNAGEKLKLITNEILCRDYENFIGYILYKKLELNLQVVDVEDQENFDWFVEVFLHNKGANDVIELLLNYKKELENENMEVYFGIYRDTDRLPEDVKHERSIVNVNG